MKKNLVFTLIAIFLIPCSYAAARYKVLITLTDGSHNRTLIKCVADTKSKNDIRTMSK